MPLSIAIVCEAPADARTVRALAERVLTESCHWIEPESVADYVQWRGFLATDPCLVWRNVEHQAKDLDLVTRLPNDLPRHPYSFKAYQAVQVLARLPSALDGVILVADSDNDLERGDGLRHVRDYFAHQRIAVGLAHTKRECWHLAGFAPSNGSEEALLAAERAKLQFDPTAESHRLTAIHSEPRCPKRVLSVLTGDSHDREMACLFTSLATLTQRGVETGLPEFLDDLTRRWLPVFGVQSRSS